MAANTLALVIAILVKTCQKMRIKMLDVQKTSAQKTKTMVSHVPSEIFQCIPIPNTIQEGR